MPQANTPTETPGAAPRWTPGPWAVSGVRTKLGGEPVLNVYSEAPGPMQDKIHALVLYGNGSAPQHVQAHADARLIAAAPELYEAVNAAPIMSMYHGRHGFEAGRFITDYEAWRVTCRAALAKARGEG